LIRSSSIRITLLSDAHWQRCTVHFYRNVFSHVPRPKMREVAAMLKAIHAAEDVQAACSCSLEARTKG
jgi:transposase-like protein